MSDETRHGEWRTKAERETVEKAMKADGYVLTGVYGGIGTFGGREVGIFEKMGLRRNTMPAFFESLCKKLSQ